MVRASGWRRVETKGWGDCGMEKRGLDAAGAAQRCEYT